MTTAEEFEKKLKPFLDDAGNIREDLLGGNFNLTAQQLRDLNTQGNTEQLQSALTNLEGRQDARDVGFLGAFDDPSRAEAFLAAQGTLAGDVDPYGQQTTQGVMRQQFTAPKLDEGEFDERTYLLNNPDVAAAVSRGEFTSGKQHYEMFGINQMN